MGSTGPTGRGRKVEARDRQGRRTSQEEAVCIHHGCGGLLCARDPSLLERVGVIHRSVNQLRLFSVNPWGYFGSRSVQGSVSYNSCVNRSAGRPPSCLAKQIAST
jgi:hypothetical protein